MSDEDKAIFGYYGICGYDYDAVGMRDGETPADNDNQDDDHHQGLDTLEG